MEDFISFEQDHTKDETMINAVEYYASPHLGSNNSLVSTIGHPLQQLIFRRFSGQSQGGKCIHDQVDPKHLNWCQRGSF